MKYIRKSISILLLVSILLLLCFNSVQADSGAIYETTTKQVITSGAVLEKITRFTDDGWLNINVLQVDLSNKNIAVDAITNPASLKTLSNVKSLAQAKNAVAAVNASFFSWMSDKTYGYPDGPIIEAGKMITAASEYNRYGDSMASFSINNLNQVMFDYWKTDITLVAPNGKSAPVGQYNKPSKDYTDFTILDRHWSDSSIGTSASTPDIAEMVVDNGKVIEIRSAQPATQIPVNGYVVITRQAGAAFLNENFKPGDTVNMNIATAPDWSKLKMSVTGSALLVKDGKIPQPFSFNIAGRYARTAVGSTKDGSQLILATVDGKLNNNVGMTQEEMAQLMISYGAYNALNLDGGGSTTMVARKPGTTEIELQNTPSDGRMRPVAAALGIFSIAPPSSLDGLIIDTEDTNVFIGTSKELTLRGYDRYFNPVQIDSSKATWSVSGIQGRFVGNVFYPSTVGEGKIKATIGSVSTEFKISVLSSPVKLELSDKSIALNSGQTKAITLTGKNINGFHAPINPTDINWKVNGSIGTISNGVFTATSNGTGYIDASLGNTHAYCAVSVGNDGSTSTADTNNIPKDTEPVDPDNKSVTFQKSSTSFRFAVFGQSGNPSNLLDKLLYIRMADKINNYLDVSAFVGSETDNVRRLIKTPNLSTGSGYKSLDYKNSRFIQLDSTSKGLRASKTGQWKWFLQQLDTANGNNIFIFLPHSQWAFNDKQETKLFQETLTKYRLNTGKNIWVFFKSASNMSYTESGVKYLSTSGVDVENLSPANAENVKYLMVTVNGSKVSYEFKSVIGN